MKQAKKTWLCLAALCLVLPDAPFAASMEALGMSSGSPAMASNGVSGFLDDLSSNGIRAEEWKRYGGGRVYWRAVSMPRQMNMGGLAFVDPASVPDLFAEPVKKRPVVRRTSPAKKDDSAAKTPSASTTLKPLDGAGLSLTPPATTPPSTVSPAVPAAIVPPLTVDSQTSASSSASSAAPSASGGVPLNQGGAVRRQASPQVTTEIWETTPPVTSAVTQPLPFLKGN